MDGGEKKTAIFLEEDLILSIGLKDQNVCSSLLNFCRNWKLLGSVYKRWVPWMCVLRKVADALGQMSKTNTPFPST